MDTAHCTGFTITPRGGESPLNADPAAQRHLLDLQAADLDLDQLAHRRAALPEAAEAEELARAHVRLRDQDVAVVPIADLEREQARADADVEQVRQRKDRDRERLDAGQVSSAKELESLQSEIASLERRQSVLEEAELDVMERLEDAQRRAARMAAEPSGYRATRPRGSGRAGRCMGRIDGAVETLRRQRELIAAEIPADLLALYEKIGPTAVSAPSRYGSVDARCRITIDPADLVRIRAAAPDVVLRCECRRIRCARPSRGCERSPTGRRGRRRCPRQPWPGGIRRGGPRRRHR